MEHPYRPNQAAATPHARVLAGPNRLRTLWHLALLLGLLGFATWAMTTRFGQRVPWLVAVFAVPVLFDVVRTLHEATLPHRVTADSRGIELAWAEKASWRPWMRRRSAAIAWDEILAIRTSTLSVNGLETTELLIERWPGLTVTIPDGTFGLGAGAVQQAILDERDDRIEAPRREAADVAGFCSERFETPRTFRLQTSAWGWASGPRVLRLQAEGLAHGATEARLELVPWSEVRFARPTLVNGEVVGVRVATTGGQEFELRGSYGIPLDELAVMIAPPVGIVLRARQRLPAALGGAPSGTS